MPVDISLTSTTKAGPPRCAFCHDDIADAELVACDACRIGLHRECWRELARCPTAGCAGTAAPVHGERCVACYRELRAGETLACVDCRVDPEDITTTPAELEQLRARRLREHLTVEAPPERSEHLAVELARRTFPEGSGIGRRIGWVVRRAAADLMDPRFWATLVVVALLLLLNYLNSF